MFATAVADTVVKTAHTVANAAGTAASGGIQIDLAPILLGLMIVGVILNMARNIRKTRTGQ